MISEGVEWGVGKGMGQGTELLVVGAVSLLLVVVEGKGDGSSQAARYAVPSGQIYGFLCFAASALEARRRAWVENILAASLAWNSASLMSLAEGVVVLGKGFDGRVKAAARAEARRRSSSCIPASVFCQRRSFT